MSSSIQSQVIDAVVAALNITQWKAYRTRMASFPPEQLPAFNVLPSEGETEYAEVAAVDRRFRFTVRCMAATVNEVDVATDALYVAGSKAILADPFLGGLVRYTREISQKWEKEGEGQYDNCALAVMYQVEFATMRSDPSVRVP